jgi:recombination protein RecA
MARPAPLPSHGESRVPTPALEGRLIEISASDERPCARTTTTLGLLRAAQAEGESTAWIQLSGGTLYPPDLEHSGIDLEALVVLHIPREPASRSRIPSASRGPHGLCRAAEILLRSGAFGFVVVDLTEGAPVGSDAWQGRLLGLARQHASRIVLLTDKPSHADSLGPLVALRIEPRRAREAPGRFTIEHHVLKNKAGAPVELSLSRHRGPWGLR